MTGLEPRGFTWVIARKLAVSERIGGSGFQHRRVRRTEEINWLQHTGLTDVLSLLGGNQNLAAYEEAGLGAHHQPFVGEVDDDDVARVHTAIRTVLSHSQLVLLVHRDTVDDAICGLLAGYLVHSGRVADPIQASAIIEHILGRPLGPEGRALLPATTG